MLSILFYPVLKMEVLLKISVVFIFISIKINLDLKVKSLIDWPSKYLILKLQYLYVVVLILSEMTAVYINYWDTPHLAVLSSCLVSTRKKWHWSMLLCWFIPLRYLKHHSFYCNFLMRKMKSQISILYCIIILKIACYSNCWINSQNSYNDLSSFFFKQRCR